MKARRQASGFRFLALGCGCSIENFQIGKVDRENTESWGCLGGSSESMGCEKYCGSPGVVSPVCGTDPIPDSRGGEIQIAICESQSEAGGVHFGDALGDRHCRYSSSGIPARNGRSRSCPTDLPRGRSRHHSERRFRERSRRAISAQSMVWSEYA